MRTIRRRSYTPRFLACAVFVCGALALAACGSSTSTTGSTSSSSSNSQAQVQDILGHVKKANLQDAHVTMSDTVKTATGANITSNSTGIITLKPTYQVDLNTTSNVNGQQIQTHEIESGGTLYVKTTQATDWQKVPLGSGFGQATSQAGATGATGSAGATGTPGASEGASPASSIDLSKMLDLTNARLVGTETINGQQVYHIQGTNSGSVTPPSQVATPAATAGATVTTQSGSVTEDLYVNKSNYQPVRVDLTSDTSLGTLTATTNFSKWNTGVTIKAPQGNNITTP